MNMNDSWIIRLMKPGSHKYLHQKEIKRIVSINQIVNTSILPELL